VLAPKYDLRLVAVQRRGYEGSTPYTEDELEAIRDGSADYVDANAMLFGLLIEHLIRVHRLPEPRIQGGGGVVLLGWSLGCARTNAFLSDYRLFGEERYQLLQRYLVGMVLYGRIPISFQFFKIDTQKKKKTSFSSQILQSLSFGFEIPRPMHGGGKSSQTRPTFTFLDAVSSHFDNTSRLEWQYRRAERSHAFTTYDTRLDTRANRADFRTQNG
jgi:hypothetical protein